MAAAAAAAAAVGHWAGLLVATTAGRRRHLGGKGGKAFFEFWLAATRADVGQVAGIADQLFKLVPAGLATVFVNGHGGVLGCVMAEFQTSALIEN